MKTLIFTLSGAFTLAWVLVVPGCSFGPEKYAGPFIDEPPPPDDMSEGATAGTAGAAGTASAGGAVDSLGGGGAAGEATAAAGAGGA